MRKESHETLDAALARLEELGAQMRRDAVGTPVDTKVLGRYEPAQQVVGRIELSGPRGLRAGLDVRGDTSAQAYTGRLRRRLIDQGSGETAYEALRRALSSGG